MGEFEPWERLWLRIMLYGAALYGLVNFTVVLLISIEKVIAQ